MTAAVTSAGPRRAAPRAVAQVTARWALLLLLGPLGCGGGATVTVRPGAEVGGEASGPMAGEGAAVLRLCTGEAGNAYHTAGERIAERLRGRLSVEVVPSAGSWENLAAIDAEPRRCDAILAQDDADALYHYEKPERRERLVRLGTLYPEYVHLICNREAVKARQVEGLHPQRHRILVDRYGSGTYITWRLFGRLSARLARHSAKEASLEDALAMVVAGTEAQCLVAVSALGRGLPALADQRHGTELVLLSIDDEALLRPVGRDRRAVYRITDVPADAYRDLSPGPWRAVTVEAGFFVSAEWQGRWPKAAQALAQALPGCCDPASAR